jgi:hypothetical protein
MLRISTAAAVLAIGATLAGCTVGISGGDSPRDHFTADVNYQRALRSAEEQARTCLLGNDAYQVQATDDKASRSGVVRVNAPFTPNDMARVDIKALGENRSDVTVVMWGRNLWNRAAVDAMHDAIVYSVPSCTSFMPSSRKAD